MNDTARTLLHALIWLSAGAGIAVLISGFASIRRSAQTITGRGLVIFCILAGLALIGLSIYMGILGVNVQGE